MGSRPLVCSRHISQPDFYSTPAMGKKQMRQFTVSELRVTNREFPDSTQDSVGERGFSPASASGLPESFSPGASRLGLHENAPSIIVILT